MKIEEIYINTMTKEKFKIIKVYEWGSAEAVSLENQWDVIAIRQTDIDNRVFDIVSDFSFKDTKECLNHSYILYTGLNKMLWYCKWCNHEKEYVNE